MDRLFSVTYSDARANFLQACLQAKAPVRHHLHPLKGPSGEALATDVARIGPDDAQDVVVVVSATHGAEGYAGSGIQVGLLETLCDELGPGQAAVLIHAINPHGFAWTRRVNEDNVDLNRNFVDHEGGHYPENDLFERLAEFIIPAQWDDESIARCHAARDAIAREVGEVAVRKAIGKGQYHHPNNVHYGGRFATWSNRVLHAVCKSQLGVARRAVLVDVHSGLGPYGYGELMTPAKLDEPVFDMLRTCFGDEVHSTSTASTAYSGSKGSILAGFRPAVEGLQYAGVGLEYGTRERSAVRRAVEADTWLQQHGDASSPLGRQIKKDLRDVFYPEETAWKTAVWERGLQVVRMSFDGLRALH
jgi:hypothetical protein